MFSQLLVILVAILVLFLSSFYIRELSYCHDVPMFKFNMISDLGNLVKNLSAMMGTKVAILDGVQARFD